MEKSWLSFLLPEDEYKERKILEFLAEASIILLFVMVILIGINKKFPQWNLDVKIALGIGIVVFLFYLTIRYTLSGIEYTDIATEKAFAKEKKLIAFKSVTFALIFLVLSVLFIGVGKTREEWLDISGVPVCAYIGMCLLSYISLKRSYGKNRDILNDE